MLKWGDDFPKTKSIRVRQLEAVADRIRQIIATSDAIDEQAEFFNRFPQSKFMPIVEGNVVQFRTLKSIVMRSTTKN